MNKTEIKKKKGFIRKYKHDILGLSAFFVALFFMILIGSLGFYWQLAIKIGITAIYSNFTFFLLYSNSF